jgi:hypothetical protein
LKGITERSCHGLLHDDAAIQERAASGRRLHAPRLVERAWRV